MHNIITIIYNKFSTFLFFLKPKKVVAQYKLFNDSEWLNVSVSSIVNHVYKIVFVISDVPWGDEASSKEIAVNSNLYQRVKQLQQQYPTKIHIIYGSWNNQLKHVQSGLDYIKENFKEASHCLYIDDDEIYDEKTITKLLKLTQQIKYFNREIRISLFTYFKSPFYQINPPEPFQPMVLFPIRKFIKYEGIRSVNIGHKNIDLWLHHLSYVRKDDIEIKNKMITHKNDEDTKLNWYYDTYLNWTPETKDFHPKEPKLFQSVKTLSITEVLPSIKDEYERW